MSHYDVRPAAHIAFCGIFRCSLYLGADVSALKTQKDPQNTLFLLATDIDLHIIIA